MAGIGNVGGGGPSPQSFQKAMVFIDGTNLFYRLKAETLRVSSLLRLVSPYVGSRQLARAYLYTVEQHLDEAKKIHGDRFCDGIRVVLGEGVPKKDGNIKEKGVDALLVADMIYHAASRNCEYALVVTVDTDFFYVLRRVEDFGCRTGLLSVCCQAPAKLAGACDDYYHVKASQLLDQKIATKV
ncbi:MAG: NYN domain-containing protein [Desulfomonile tiedjei]|nr:NYN domain-containing protein [Desulfomonile tiedjei]